VKPWLALAAIAITLLARSEPGTGAQAVDAGQGRGWPPAASETKPWTRWWWQGSAVERGSLSEQLEALRDGGSAEWRLRPSTACAAPSGTS
jgi:hypothetical protein